MASVSFSHADLTTRARTFATATATSIAGPCVVFSMAAGAGSGGPIELALRDGTATDSTLIAILNVGANDEDQYNWEPCGIKMGTALTLTSVGSIDSIVVTYLEL